MRYGLYIMDICMRLASQHTVPDTSATTSGQFTWYLRVNISSVLLLLNLAISHHHSSLITHHRLGNELNRISLKDVDQISPRDALNSRLCAFGPYYE
jgi:hypothetical protein